MTVDSGYSSAENIGKEETGVELLIASGREEKERVEATTGGVYSAERFERARKSDSWKCPGTRFLVREEKVAAKSRPLLRCYWCQDHMRCSLEARCLKPGKERRTLLVERKQLVRAEIRARVKKPGGAGHLSQARMGSEQVIGQIKEGLGFGGGNHAVDGLRPRSVAVCLRRGQRNEGREAYLRS